MKLSSVYVSTKEHSVAETYTLLSQIRSSHLVVNASDKNPVGDNSAEARGVVAQAAIEDFWG